MNKYILKIKIIKINRLMKHYIMQEKLYQNLNQIIIIHL